MKVFKFDGNQNIRHFVRHVRETVSSLEMNRVPKKYQVQVAARNLEKKAYDYYEQHIANNASDWTISQMYEALFNHIFPMDFRIGCRGRFNSLTQGGKTITEFAFELKELADLIGDVSEHEKVTRLWYGSRPSMQSALWTDRLHPEMSSWEKVLDHALYIELSEKPMKKAESSQSRPFDNKKKSKPAHSGNSQNTNSHSHKTPSHSNQQSSKNSSDRPLNHNPSSSGKSKNKKGTSNQKGSSEQKLSKKEEDELRAANKCFLCKETGHVRRNCPKANSVKSSSNRPPGVSNFNVEFVDVEDTMEGVLDSLHCSSMSFAEDDLRIDQAQQMTENSRRIPSLLYQPGFRWRKPRPDMDDWTYFSRRRVAKQLGNARQKVALNILNSSQPYPGDTVPTGKVLQDRFRFVEEVGEDWLLYNRLLDRYYLIEAYQLRNPDFTPGDWYAQIRQVKAGLKEEMLTNGRRMGDAVAYVAECHLRDGILWYYPTPKSTSQVYHEDHFRVRRHSAEFYEISDYARRSATMIEVSHLENPCFNLARWYHLLVQQKRSHGNREHQFNPEPDSRWSPLPFTSSNADSSDESVESRQSDGTTTPPPLLSISASSDSDSSGSEEEYDPFDLPVREIGDPYAERLRETLCLGAPYPGEESLMEKSHEEILALVNRFAVERTGSEGRTFSIRDTHLGAVFHVPETFAMDPNCSPRSWYARKRAGCIRNGDREFAAWSLTKIKSQISIGAVIEEAIEQKLLEGVPYTQDNILSDPHDLCRFCIHPELSRMGTVEAYMIVDRGLGILKQLPAKLVQDFNFRPADWFQKELNLHFLSANSQNPRSHLPLVSHPECPICRNAHLSSGPSCPVDAIEVAGIQVPRDSYKGVQRNAAWVKGTQRVVPKPIVVVVNVNGHPARALMDSGSLGDFISSTLVDQLKLKREKLDDPLNLQLAVQGSKSKITSKVKVRIAYQDIDEDRGFDVINVSNYDLILGTPFLYQHQVCVGLNPARVVIGSATSLPIKEDTTTRVVVSGISIADREVDEARTLLQKMAEPLCKDLDEIPLPPLRAINHTVPLIDEKKVYPWRPSKCPEVFRPQWAEKRDQYLKSGRWEITSAGNTVPMLFIPKPKKDKPELRTVIDLRERNKNTKKLTSPLPDIEGILRRLANKPFRSSLDMKAAYEQIRVIPEHVPRTAMTTLDGNMVSHVVQQGDCNAPATYQALMNHIFSPYIGRFMDVYLDDIVIYSDTLKEHIKHLRLIFEILKREKLYLSRSKLRFLVPELDILGHVVDDHGIRMDPAKVDSVLAWKTPTNHDLLCGFLGSVGYLADDVPGVRIPMGVLSAITGDTVPFRWGFTEQRAFEDVKRLVHKAREHRRKPLDYSPGAAPIWVVTDGCATGIAGVISQGDDWRTAKVAAFYSAKLNDAQRNYPTHEVEMLAGVESMLRHADILQGAKFQWITDHKGLIHLLDQEKLSGRKARWMEKIALFDFTVVYVPGTENVLADSLSRMYSNDAPGTIRAPSEYTYFDVADSDTSGLAKSTAPLLTGLEALSAVISSCRSRRTVPSAETGREETSSEWAARIAATKHFTLKGPREQEGDVQEGCPLFLRAVALSLKVSYALGKSCL
ncbi:hypothetical protein H1R20_g15976, partial [Candolleomyces eurysporus]